MHTDISLPPPALRPGGGVVPPVLGVLVAGYSLGMTEDRIEQRASDLLPEERAAGSADPEAQAEAILAESDEREDRPEPDEQRRSTETTR
jgi:hypothetical protein